MSQSRRTCVAFGAMLLLLVATTPPASAVIEDVLDVIHVVKEITVGVLKAWDIVQQTPFGQNVDFPLMREKQKKVLQRLRAVSRQIGETEEKYAQHVALATESVNAFVIQNIPLMTKRNDISETMDRISSRFKQMQQYETHQDKLESATLIQFAEWSVSPNAYSVHHLMNRLHLALLGHEDKENTTTNMLAMLQQSYEESAEQLCHTHQSSQQFVYSLYTDIALTELKGYTMMEFSWMILRIYGKGNFTQEAELMRNDFQERTSRTLRLLREVMRRAKRELYRCDPAKYVSGATYDEVTRLLQGYVENEVDMHYDGSCFGTCYDYNNVKSQGCFKNLYCAQQPRCNGKLYSCSFVDADMWVCPATWNSTRRYEYIEYENGSTLGKKISCVRGTTKVDSWWRYLFWHCSYCFCLCDEMGPKSDRYFNLRESLSDVNNNKVVVGLRFTKKNRIFHLQIQEGELLPRGTVNTSSLTWSPVANYNIYDDDARNGRDFHTLRYESRAIDLDDIHTDDTSFVVTGVRFRLVGTHLNLEARLSEFDFETGKLVNPAANSFWKSNDNTDVSGERRIKVTLKDPDVPTRTIVKSMIDSQHNQFIEFTNTNQWKDAAQSTVPFLDTQDVVSQPPVPLAGIGIYHKGRDGYGGFVAPKIITYDYTQHVQVPQSQGSKSIK